MDTLLNPLAMVEVLSDSTEKYDRGTKFAQYRKILSLQEFILAAQDQPLLERYARQPDGDWLLTEFRGLEITFEMTCLRVKIPMNEIYRGVEFPETPPR